MPEQWSAQGVGNISMYYGAGRRGVSSPPDDRSGNAADDD
jgi:hypothetical protein